MSTDTQAETGVVCPLCGWTGDRFDPMGRIPRPNALCPQCNSLERHRAMYLYLRDETDLFSRPVRLLHFAPEPALREVFLRHENIDYVTSDLERRDVSVRMDITDIIFKDDVFDCVICSHVLEHVDDDRAAMREIERVLRPDGFALIMVPILRTPDGQTIEDPAVVTPEERERVYGQADHVRAYGEDFPQRAQDALLDVTVVRYPNELGAEATARFGLEEREQLFVCTPLGGAAAASTLDFIGDISPSDGMLNSPHRERYFDVGLDALRIVEDALSATGSGPPRRILDLPSGYGRVMRMLHAAFPGAALTACDVDSEAVAFCERTFGAAPVIADPDPDALRLSSMFDLIWCGSLLTHLPERDCEAMLAQFERHLEPGGVLIFTTHGRQIDELLGSGRVTFDLEPGGVARLRDGFSEEGFGFEPYPHSTDGSYGVALASKSWVLRALARHPRLQLVSYNEGDWDSRQDSVVCRAR